MAQFIELTYYRHTDNLTFTGYVNKNSIVEINPRCEKTCYITFANENECNFYLKMTYEEAKKLIDVGHTPLYKTLND